MMWDRDARHARRDALFGGRGSVRVWDLLGAGTSGSLRVVLACELDPGGSVGRHVQEALDEVVIVLEGTGRATVDATPIPLAPGVTVSLALGSTLSIENASAEAPLRYLIVKADPRRTAS